MRLLHRRRVLVKGHRGIVEHRHVAWEDLSTSGRRGIVGCFVVFCLIGGVCVSRSAEQFIEPVVRQVQAACSSTVGYGSVIDGSSDPYELAAISQADVFADEVTSLAGRSEGRIDEEARIIGWSCEGRASDALSSTAAELEQKGWKRMESGYATCMSFTKASGCYRWAFLMCAQIGSSVSVVIQVS